MKSDSSAERAPAHTGTAPDGAKQWQVGLYATFSAGTTAVFLYASSAPRRQFLGVLAAGMALAVVALLLGGLVGFLFGIPRSRQIPQSDGSGGAFEANTNLEQVSDWLTKILVGVGLIQLGRAPDALGRLGRSMAPMLDDRAHAPGFALAIAGSFAAGGFLWTYLWARIDLLKDFTAAAQVERRIVSQNENDADALALAGRILQGDGAAVGQEQLDHVMREASPFAAVQVFDAARANHAQHWKAEPADASRSIPVLRALVARPDSRDRGEWHSRLGYALTDKPNASQEELGLAVTSFDRAVDIKHRQGDRPSAVLLWNRARARILLAQAGANVPDDAILADLRLARAMRLNDDWFVPTNTPGATSSRNTVLVHNWLVNHGGLEGLGSSSTKEPTD